MKKYNQPQPVDAEREMRLAIMEQELRALLWQRLHIPDGLVHVAADLSAATWQALKANGDAPPRITVGRRVYVLTSDLRAWIESRPKTTGATKPQSKNERFDNDDDDDANQTGAAPARPSLASGLQAASRPRVR